MKADEHGKFFSLPVGMGVFTLHSRFFVDVYGLDDSLILTLNGRVILRQGMADTCSYWDITPTLALGQNTLEVSFVDNNDGFCWDAGFRLGVGIAWQFNNHFANSPCRSGGLPHRQKVVYKRVFLFELRP